MPSGITLTESKHPFTFLVSEDSDGAGYLSRDTAMIAPSQNIVVGQVLARATVPANVTASVTAKPDNTGNGVLTLASPAAVAANAQVGNYKLLFLTPTAFEFFDPDGILVGSGAVGAPFSNQIRFQVAAGSTAFVAGDSFKINVNLRTDAILENELYAAWAPGALAVAIAVYPAVTNATQTARITVINAHATVGLEDIVFGGSPTLEQIEQAKRDLGRRLIKFR